MRLLALMLHFNLLRDRILMVCVRQRQARFLWKIVEALVEFEGLLQLSEFLLSGPASILQRLCLLSRLLELLCSPLVDQVVV